MLLSVIILGVSRGSRYTKGLIRYLQQKSKLHQVMFIIDDKFLANAETNVDTQLIRDVSKRFPSMKISTHDARANLEKYFSSHPQIPRRTTLFIFILNIRAEETMSHLNASFIEFWYRSQGNSFPKCLIHFSRQGKALFYENFLKRLWHNYMLDISVLENLVANRSWQTKNTISIHRVNLFKNKYTNQKITPRSKWFPNKLLDLHGQQIKLMLTSNDFLKPKEYYYEIGKFGSYIAQSMHCGVKIHHSRERVVNSSLLIKTGSEMTIDTVFILLTNASIVTNPIRILFFSTAKAVIPNVRSKTQSFKVSEEFVYMIVTTTVAIAVIRIAALLVKFNSSIWNTFNICQIIMGMSVVNEPRKLAERIAFGAFMLSSMVYSGYMFSVILDINFREAPQITTLEELANSSLTPMTFSYINDSMLKSPLVYIRKLASKAGRLHDSVLEFQCLNYLFHNKNISCVLSDVEKVVNVISKANPEFSFKMLRESVVFFPTSWLARSGSPFIDRFNEIILKAFDYGFLQKLLFPNELREIRKISSPEIIEKEKLLLVLFYVLTIGHTLAAVVLLVEISRNFLRRKAKEVWANVLNFF